jgi:hypothetical protein
VPPNDTFVSRGDQNNLQSRDKLNDRLLGSNVTRIADEEERTTATSASIIDPTTAATAQSLVSITNHIEL